MNLHIESFVVLLSYPEDRDYCKYVAARDALAELGLRAKIKTLVLENIETREALDDVWVRVSSESGA